MSVLVEEPKCDACGSAALPRERITREGTALVVCSSAKLCIQQAIVMGRWQGRAR